MVEGVSSAHSWIKVQTMIRPTKLGENKDEGEKAEMKEEVESWTTSTEAEEVRTSLAEADMME